MSRRNETGPAKPGSSNRPEWVSPTVEGVGGIRTRPGRAGAAGIQRRVGA